MNLTDHAELKRYESFYPAGSVIFSEGDQARDLYVLASGRLDVVKGDKKISEIKEPDFFGELSYLLGTPRIASVIAADDSRVLQFPSGKVQSLWKKFPEFGEYLAKILAKRLHDTTNVAQGFREFCDRMPDAVIMTDTRHRVLSWNRSAEKLYGRTWEQMRDKSIEEIYDNQASFHKFMAELPKHGAVSRTTLKINHPQRDWFFVATSATLLKDPHDNIQGYLFLGNDATHQQQLVVRHQRIKKWLIPLLLLITLLIGWSLTQHFSSPAPDHTVVPGNANSFHAGFTRDTKSLKLALAPALSAGNLQIAQQVLEYYFRSYQPYLLGISGVLILDDANKVVVVHTPSHPGCSILIGRPYDGSRYPGSQTSNGDLDVYLADRPESVGGRSVEAVMEIYDSENRTTGRLVMRLTPETLKKKYGLAISDLASSK